GADGDAADRGRGRACRAAHRRRRGDGGPRPRRRDRVPGRAARGTARHLRAAGLLPRAEGQVRADRPLMLLELAVRDHGVIDELSLVLDAGMTAITGETGAGKTLVVEAVELLVGGRADAVLVRPGADEARVDGR